MPGQLFNGLPIPLVASAARTTSSNSGTLKNTSLAIPVCEAATFILDVTTNTGSGSTNTLDLFIDTSPDAGTTWYAAYHFAQVTGSTSQQRLEVRDTGIGVQEVGATVANLAASTVFNTNTVTTEDMRVRWVLGTAGNTVTFAVWAIVQPLGTKQ